MRTAGELRAAGEERFRARAAADRRRRLGRALMGLLVLLLIGAVVWAVAFSGLFAVQEVAVSGAHEEDEQEVEEIADEAVGTPLLRVDGEALAGRISSEVPGVKSAEIDRSVPHTLKVKVRSRVPALAVRQEGGGYRLMDLSGVVFRSVETVPKGVPTVTPQSGANVSKHGVRAAQGMLEAFPDDVREKITAITVDPADQITFELGGTRVIWGSGEEADLKVDVISILLDKKPEVIDVTAPEAPVTKG